MAWKKLFFGTPARVSWAFSCGGENGDWQLTDLVQWRARRCHQSAFISVLPIRRRKRTYESNLAVMLFVSP